MIKFSIIIPHYNIPELLERLLLSIPYEKEDVEVIVVDDRSDNNLGKLQKIKREYEKSGIRFFRNNKGRKGAGTCRNIGLRHAKGKWILFADADDRYTDRLYGFFKKNENADEEMIFFKTTSVFLETNETATRHLAWNEITDEYLQNPSHVNEIKLRYNIVSPVVKMIKKDLLDDRKIRFDESTMANDIVFSAKVALWAESIKAEDEILYIITERNNSMVRQYDIASVRERNKEIYKYDRLLKSYLSQEDLRILDRSGTGWIMGMIYHGASIRCIAQTIAMYVRNGVKPIDCKKVNILTIPVTYIKSRFCKEYQKSGNA